MDRRKTMRLLRHRGLLLAMALIALAGAVALSGRLSGAPAAADNGSALTDAAQGAALMQQARETGDPTLYTRASAAFDAALKRDPHSVEGLIGKGALALAMHQFRAGLALGEQARALDPRRALVYGVIGDAQTELGQYDAAVDTLQTMINLRPDLSSYSRAAYARELNGDSPGAILLMQQALQSGAPNSEALQWVRVQLGNLYFSKGDLATAEGHYQNALTQLPGYGYALAGLGRVRAAQGRFDEARPLYQQAIAHVPLPEFVIGLGEMEQAAGRPADAARQYDLVRVMQRLFQANGVNTDMEMALFEADHGAPAIALKQARDAYRDRPNIKAADTLAWALSQAGDQAEAQRYMTEALKLGTQDALFFYHAGMIAYRSGDRATARTRLQQALAVNPYFSLFYAADAQRMLDQALR
jgi:tetratricopeptide (TPR) repeat protein